MADLPHIGPPETPTSTKPVQIVTNDVQPHIARPYAPLIGMLDIDSEKINEKTQTALEELWDYLGKQTGSDLNSERLNALMGLENRLSPPRIGQTRLQRLQSYVQAQKAVEQAEEWRNSHLKGATSERP